MKTSVLAEKEDGCDLTQSIKMKILDYMNTKYDNPAIKELLYMVCLMDPRFKVSYIIKSLQTSRPGGCQKLKHLQ